MSEIRAAIYVRVSTEKQERQDTIASQLAQIQDRIKAAGYTLVEVYEDNGYSGELLARPGLDRLRDDLPRNKFDRVLVNSPDRLARKFLYQELVAEEFRKHGVVIEFLNMRVAETAEDRLLLGVQGLFSEYEKAKILERVRRGKLHKAAKGLIVGGMAPYGYRYQNGLGRYVIEPREAETVKMIFNLIVEDGLTLRGIVRRLTELGVPKPTVRGSKAHWARSTLGRIVRNETYTGLTHYNKWMTVEPKKKRSLIISRVARRGRRLKDRSQWVGIQVPAIIDRRTFDLAQERVKRNRVFANGPSYSTRYLLRGLIVCGACGSAMVGETRGSSYYRCDNRARTFPLKRTCFARSQNCLKVEGAVWAAIESGLSKPETIQGQIDKVMEDIAKTAASEAVIDVSQERLKVEREADRILEAYSGGAIELDQLKAHMDKIKTRKAELVKIERAQAASKANESIGVASLTECIHRGIAAAAGDRAKMQELLRLIVDRVIVEPGKVRIRCVLPGQILSMPSSCYRQNPPMSFELVGSI